MIPDWTALTPHRPVDADDDKYVPPPSDAGREIADRVVAGTRTLLVGGPAGIGKSTEMGRAASLLLGSGGRVACLVSVDTWENMRRITPERLLLRIAGRVAFAATQDLQLPLNHELLAALAQYGVLDSSVLTDAVVGQYKASPRALARAVLDEVGRLSEQGRITLLIDGMEKVPDAPSSVELFDALADLPDHVDQVVVVPWHVTYGAHNETVIRPGEHWTILQPARTDGDEGESTRAFLRNVMARRLSVDPEQLAVAPSASRVTGRAMGEGAIPSNFVALVDQAAVWSGGIPRVFLQLVADAGTYARLQNKSWPDDGDLADAVADLEDTFRRALLPGDTEACIAADGTDGRELELDRKVRLLARGVLLERRVDRRVNIEIHPLAIRSVMEGAAHA